MRNDDQRLEITAPLRLSALPTVRHQVSSFLRACVPEGELGDILLCLQEALKNAVRFSQSDRDLDVEVELFDHTVHLVVRDHGVGFAVKPRKAPPRPDPMADAGRGLFLITQLMDEVEFVSDHGAEVRMLKRLG